MAEEDYTDEGYSETVQDVFGNSPNFIVRWGSTIMFLVCIILIALTWIIRYPDTIPAQITIKTSITPKPLISKNDGKIIRLFVKDGTYVKKGEVMAYMESQADVNQILDLEKQLLIIDTLLKSNNWNSLRSVDFIKFNRFGEIQTTFETFFLSFQTLQAYWQGTIMADKQQVLNQELRNIGKMNKSLQEQEREFKKDLQLAEEEYKTYLNLFFEEATNLQELRNAESKYISKKLVYKQIQTSILNNANAVYSSSKQLVDIADNIEQEKINFIRVFNLLKNEVENWKTNYILTAPETGKVSFSYSIEEYKMIPKGQELFYVLPDKIDYLGEIFLDQYNLGKVEAKQQVIIKLKSYPFEEYGLLRGEIENISEVDIDKKYLIRVILPQGLKTSMDKDLKFRFGMLGDAEIITKNTRVIDKILYKFRKAGS